LTTVTATITVGESDVRLIFERLKNPKKAAASAAMAPSDRPPVGRALHHGGAQNRRGDSRQSTNTLGWAATAPIERWVGSTEARKALEGREKPMEDVGSAELSPAMWTVRLWLRSKPLERRQGVEYTLRDRMRGRMTR
jgi:hypothetical protein